METRARMSLAGSAVLLCLVPLAARLLWLQVVRHGQLAGKARSETAGIELRVVPRGRILDREGRVLAESLSADSGYLDLSIPKDRKAAIRAACRALGMDPSPLLGRLKPSSRFLWLKRQMTPEETSRLQGAGLEEKGLSFLGLAADEVRVYPNGDMLKSVLGSVDIDGKGLSGMELAFNKDLVGRTYKVRMVRDGKGRTIAQEAQAPERAPPDLRLSIDLNAQHFAEAELREAVRARKAARGTVVIQEPSTGDILALASYPPDPLRNPAVQDVYEPGSTFKLVAAAAALERGLYAEKDLIDCENGRWAVAPGVAINDHEPSGLLTLSGVIERSSNIGTAKVALRVGPAQFHRACRLFGFGYRTGVPLPGESSGLLPPVSSLTPVRLANAGFGQGVAVTALQLSAAYSSVANGGVLMEPRLVLAVGNRRNAPVRIRRSVSPEALGRLRSMLEGVVLRGTGQSVQVPGFPTAGKTGTAQKIDARTGKYSHSDYVSSFVGFVPAGEPRFAILVAIDGPRVGYYGAEVAGPVFARIARELLALSATAPSLPLSVRIPTGPNASRLAPRPAAAPEPPGPGEGAGLKAGSPARSPQAGAKAPRVPA